MNTSTPPKRAIVLVLDSFGVGYLEDAHKFGDQGSNTLGHIAQYCQTNQLSFNIPNLLKLGLGETFNLVNHHRLHIDDQSYTLNGSFGACKELSSGKDTTSGHWEIAGCPVLFDWGYFKAQQNSFPAELLDQIMHASGLDGFLGNCHASGTEIIKNLGEEHLKTGWPIFYTSGDSVFQIACHEKSFGLDRLYQLCQIVRELLAPYNIARVIARPFSGDTADSFIRTGNRKDYSLLPNGKTLLDICKDQQINVVAIGKIGDIYAHQGTTKELKAVGLEDLCNKTLDAIQAHVGKPALIMTNLVDFDMQYGHRRDIVGYKTALEYFDTRLPEIIAQLSQDDILVLSADHGCDPSWNGFDHTREYIPFLVYKNALSYNLGIRSTFADIGQTIAHHLNVPQLAYGTAASIK